MKSKKQIFMIKITGDRNGTDAHLKQEYRMSAEFATASIKLAREKLDELELDIQQKKETQEND